MNESSGLKSKAALATAVAKKRVIFTVTTGRTGTNLLAKALNVSRSIYSVHESKVFTTNMRAVQSCPDLAANVWANEMLPEINSHRHAIYAETGHLVCKGYLEPLLGFDVVPDLIHIKRNARAVALSYTALDSIPGRSPRGLKYLLSPEDPGVLPLPGHQELNGYQLNYWYCLEIERRAQEQAELIRERGGRVAELPFSELVCYTSFRKFWGDFGLPELSGLGWWRIKRILSHKVNAKAKNKRSLSPEGLSPDELAQLEQEVVARINANGMNQEATPI